MINNCEQKSQLTLLDWIKEPFPNEKVSKALTKSISYDSSKNLNMQAPKKSLTCQIENSMSKNIISKTLDWENSNEISTEKIKAEKPKITHIEVTKNCEYFYTLDSSQF